MWGSMHLHDLHVSSPSSSLTLTLVFIHPLHSVAVKKDKEIRNKWERDDTNKDTKLQERCVGAITTQPRHDRITSLVVEPTVSSGEGARKTKPCVSKNEQRWSYGGLLDAFSHRNEPASPVVGDIPTGDISNMDQSD